MSKFFSSILLISILALSSLCSSIQAQCSYSSTTPPASTDCAASIDINPYLGSSQCETLCVTSGSSGVFHNPNETNLSCTDGSNDIWIKVLIDNTAVFPDKSLVFAFKDYPGNTPPVVAAYAEINGTITVNIGIPLALTFVDDCSNPPTGTAGIVFTDDFLLFGDTVTVDVTTPPVSLPTTPCFSDIGQNGDQLYFAQDFLIEAQDVTDLLAANLPPDASADITSVAIYLQIQPEQAGEVCFEISAYGTGTVCGDANALTFDATANAGSETQIVSDCLCNSAINGSLSSLSTSPPSNFCAGNAGVKESAVWYEVNADYACSQIEVALNSWTGTGNVNVAIVADVDCAPITDPTLTSDLFGEPITPPPPGAIVNSYTELASGCLMAGDVLSTDAATCLNGTYWIVVEGVEDRNDFELAITIKEPAAPGITADLKVLLEGGYDATTGLMHTTLNNMGLVPPEQPFSRSPWFYSGTEMIAVADMPANLVDWVLVELRDAADNTLVVDTRAALLLNDGSVVDIANTTNPVTFANAVANTDYYVVVRHRNHLAVMSSALVNLPNLSTYDFTMPGNTYGGDAQQVAINSGVLALYAGDTNSNGVINFTDFNAYVADLGSNTDYFDGDYNFDNNVDTGDFDLLQPNTLIIGMDEIRY